MSRSLDFESCLKSLTMVCSHRSHRELVSAILFEFDVDVELKMNFVLYMNFEMQMSI